jgi:hypothetical protein
MRSLLAKSSILILIILALGSGLTLAAIPSKPGMFLYPIKQTTQRFTGDTDRSVTSLTPVIEVPQDDPSQQPSVNIDARFEQIQADATEEPGITEPRQANEPTATPAPTLVRIVDEITVTTKPEEVSRADSDSTADNIHSSAAMSQLGSGHDNNAPDDGQPESADVNQLDDGHADNDESSDNDSGHSENKHDDDSNEDDEDDHD